MTDDHPSASHSPGRGASGDGEPGGSSASPRTGAEGALAAGPPGTGAPATGPRSRPAPRPPLTPEDIRRLTLYKWRYSLESSGFTTGQVGHLLFLKWMYANATVRG